MNVAFSALLAFLLLLPGFIFRTRFKRAEKEVLDVKPFGQAAISAFLAACILDAAWYWLTIRVTNTHADFKAMLALMIGEKSASLDAAINEVALDPWRPFLFFATLYVTSFGAGWALRYFVTLYRLDRKDARFAGLLRFDTPWYYLFSGYDRATAPDGVAIGAVVCLGATPYLYTGILVEYFLNEQGQPDRLVLTSAARRKLSEDALADEHKTKPLDSSTNALFFPTIASALRRLLGVESTQQTTERFYPIQGDYFVLRYSEILTLNVRYIDLS